LRLNLAYTADVTIAVGIAPFVIANKVVK